MPYDIHVFRGERDAPTPITRAELFAVLRGLRDPDPATSDGRVWAEQTPWFVADVDGDGAAVLSASYTNPDFLRLLARFGAEAVRIGEQLGARVIEEVGNHKLTTDNVDEIYALGSPLVMHMWETVGGVWAGINQQSRAPLDFPVGPFDLVSEYYMFHLRDAANPSEAAVRDVLRSALGAHRLRRERPGAFSVLASHEPPGVFARMFGRAPRVPELVKILARPDGVVQIWPWWDSGLASFGPLALDVATRLHDALGGRLTLVGAPFTDTMRAELATKFAGSLTDLWSWTQKAVRDAAGEPPP